MCVISYLIIYTAYYPSLKNFWEDLPSFGRFFRLSHNGKYCTQGLLVMFLNSKTFDKGNIKDDLYMILQH